MGGELVRVGVGGAGDAGGSKPFAADGIQDLVGWHGGCVDAGKELGLELGQAGNHATKSRDGGVFGLGGLSTVSGRLPVLADAEGASGRVHAGMDEVQ